MQRIRVGAKTIGAISGLMLWGLTMLLGIMGIAGVLRDLALALFSMNPILIVSCGLLKSGKCIGLGFDGGPLEWAERVWFWCLPIVYALIGVAVAVLTYRLVVFYRRKKSPHMS